MALATANGEAGNPEVANDTNATFVSATEIHAGAEDDSDEEEDDELSLFDDASVSEPLSDDDNSLDEEDYNFDEE